MIEKFTQEQFENALPSGATCDGLVSGELVYHWQISDVAAIKIRSSIDKTGFAGESGDDSIRVWLVKNNDGKPFAHKVNAWTQRVSGWQSRLYDKLEMVSVYHRRAGVCDSCGNPFGIFLSEKTHKFYSRCWICNKWGGKVDGNITPDEKKWFGDLFKSGFSANSVHPADSTEIDVEQESGVVPAETPYPTDSAFDLFFSDDDDTETVEINRDMGLDLSKLDEHQAKIVANLGRGPHVAEACPGSGKTYTLEHLIAAMLSSGVDATRIGAFTFSVRAASEMRRRIAKTIWPDISDADLEYLTEPNAGSEGRSARREWVDDDPRRSFIVDWVCTIHALAYRLLRRAGYEFGVLSGRDEREAKELVKDTLLELDWEESPRSVALWISHAILSLVEPNGSERWFANMLDQLGGPVWTARNLEEIYKRYMAFLKSRNLLDFDLMQARVIWLIRNNPAFKKDIQGMFDYILVDEAQDTSPIQTEILFTLAEKTRNIMLCGDVDQSMYAFRGAVPSVLREDFKEYWGETKRFVLPTNYRSTQAIVKSAAKLISNNYGLEDDYLKPFNWKSDAEAGADIETSTFLKFDDLTQEIAKTILETGNPGGWFVLSRTRAECAQIHTRLIESGIPAINKVGGLLFGAPHIKKVLAYARLACNYQDSRNNLEVLKEIANVATIHFKAPMTRRRHVETCHAKPWENCGCPILIEESIDYSHARFYGQKSIEKAGNWNGVLAQQSDRNRGGYPTLEAKGSQDLVYFVHRLEALSGDALSTLNTIIHDCVLPWLAAEEGVTNDDLAENGKAEEFGVLTNMVVIGETTEQFLSRMDGISSRNGQDESKSVLVGTFHWSKGSERPNVIVNVTRCPVIPPVQEAGKLPVGSAVDIQEERRLAFVGITRAKDRVFVLQSTEWDGRDVPISLFLAEVK